MSDALVSSRGAMRWAQGHPWIFKSDVITAPGEDAGVVMVRERSGAALGWALWSPRSEIALRLLERAVSATIDGAWWRSRIEAAVARRSALGNLTNAFRLVHGEADGVPSLICDRYDRWLVVQLLSAGLERHRSEIVAGLTESVRPAGILARNDANVRDREGLPREIALLAGDVPREIEVVEHGVKYLAAPWDGQKTGAFLDQRENRVLAGSVARGRALDCFSYHGSFALHLARRAERVTALDSSAAALARAKENAMRNGFTNIDFREADAFEFLRDQEKAGARYETIVLDPPAFAKNKASLPAAIRGYKEINLRAMRLLSPGGMLFTASCSYHLSKTEFLRMIEDAARDSGRRVLLRNVCVQAVDHPELITMPESGYLKGAVLEARS